LMTPEDATMVSDLVVAAYNDAKKKVEEQISSGMSGILPPGMKLPF
ncbi:MAG: YbaB/EbfC family nucleoid-associated protein, partial [Alphaproteobacteria bacterium]|nr:YbaB/EbfC family nucleoid-associated protein [Alphaproteobacteria bacterium]